MNFRHRSRALSTLLRACLSPCAPAAAPPLGPSFRWSNQSNCSTLWPHHLGLLSETSAHYPCMTHHLTQIMKHPTPADIRPLYAHPPFHSPISSRLPCQPGHATCLLLLLLSLAAWFWHARACLPVPPAWTPSQPSRALCPATCTAVAVACDLPAEMSIHALPSCSAASAMRTLSSCAGPAALAYQQPGGP